MRPSQAETKESPEQPDPRDTEKKNWRIIIALACGLTLPFVHVGLFAKYLPNWLNVMVVGVIWWICFECVIPDNVVGVFRKRRK